MFDAIYKSLTRVVSLSPEELLLLSSKLKVKELKRKDFLLREGETCSFTAFITAGCLRYFYNHDGQERTGQFFFENSWYSDYESFISDEPSTQNIQALEATRLLILPKASLYQLYEENPKFERFGRIMAENAYLGCRQKNMTLLTESPEEQYLHLLKTRPKIIERVSQIHIASFLGIQPESLSRIRKRIARSA